MAAHDSHTTKKKRKPLWKKVLILTFALGLAGLLTGAGLFTYYANQAPVMNKKALVDPIPTKILDMNGDLITTIGPEKRQLVEYEEIPSLVENAVLATEDVRFYDHFGVDPIRLGAAVIANIKEGFGAEGGSTITQQVIKRSFLTSKKSLKRKAQEAWLAVKFEKEHSKKEILELYLNKTYYSDNIYGIQTAARYYYNKNLNELTLAQAALLAGIPQSPNNYNPYDYPERAEARRNTVLALMEQHGKITAKEMNEAQQVSITKGLVNRTKETRNQLTTKKGYEAFIDVVISELEKEGNYNLYQDGLSVHTTLDPKAQKQVEKILNSEEIIDYPDAKDGQPFQAGLTLLDTQSGAVRAVGGGRNYGEETKRGFNFAVDITRQPGSVIKPLLVYAPAIEKLQWSTAHILEDEPFEYKTGQKPQNWDGEFKGPITIREALWDSRNIPAIKAFNEIGHPYASEFINNLGLNIDETLYESAAIGGIRSSINTIDLAGAYAAFGNGGTYNEPHVITKIEFRDGSSVDIVPESHQAMKDYTAYMITDMLKDVIEHPEGTGNDAQVPGLPVAGKTGTTNYTEEMQKKYNINPDNAPDSWFAGYTTNYTAAVWTGYLDLKNYLTPEERRTAQKIFSQVMEQVSKETDTPDFERPKSVVEAKIVEGTQPPKLASDSTSDEDIITELFVKGTEPTEEFDDSKETDKKPDKAKESNEDSNNNNEEQDNSDEKQSNNNAESSSIDKQQQDNKAQQTSADQQQQDKQTQKNSKDQQQQDDKAQKTSEDQQQQDKQTQKNSEDQQQQDDTTKQTSEDQQQQNDKAQQTSADQQQQDDATQQTSADQQQDDTTKQTSEDQQQQDDKTQQTSEDQQQQDDTTQQTSEDQQQQDDTTQQTSADQQQQDDTTQQTSADDSEQQNNQTEEQTITDSQQSEEESSSDNSETKESEEKNDQTNSEGQTEDNDSEQTTSGGE